VVNQLLAELDGPVANNDGVFVLAATNHPWDVDAALRRPGRLDRTVLVLPPDLPARVEILTRALAKVPSDDIDVERLADATDGYSGADLVQIVNVATEKALAQAMRTGERCPIRRADLKLAKAEVSASTLEWFSVAHGYAVYANSTGEYDELLQYIREKKLL
jgi:SpoVK/Ycf46/Vps4 family AAA+-type ATPase